MALAIRRGGTADAGAAADVWLAARAAAAASGAIPRAVHRDEEVRGFFAAQVVPERELWVAEDDARVAGILVLDGDWIDQLYVAPRRTGRGIGAALLAVAQRERPGAALRLWTFAANAGARRFYERHGFVAVHVTDGRDNEERAPDVLYARLRADPAALAAVLPDVPLWVWPRASLLSGRAEVRLTDAGDGALVVDRDDATATVVGQADAALLRGELAGAPAGLELLVPEAAVDAARVALPRWHAATAIVHELDGAVDLRAGAAPAGVVISAPPDAHLLRTLPDDVRRDATAAAATAVRVVDGDAVAVCQAASLTEGLWDVGIDTLEPHRREGHAEACFRALAGHLAAGGRRPVWAAYDDYPPSLRLAAKLGFRAVGRLGILTAPD